MEKYLLELIKEHNRVIVPNFGAFIVSREKGQTILFNNFLSFNDGLLINHVCKVDNVDTATATSLIDEFVRSANATLDQKGIFKMEYLGTFTKDQNGILRFIQKENEADQEPSVPVFKSAKHDKTTDLLDIEVVATTNNDVVTKPLANQGSTTSEKITAAGVSRPSSTASRPVQNRESKKPVSKVEPFDKASPRKERGSFSIWLMVLLIMLPILLVLAYFLLFKRSFPFFAPKTATPVEQAITNEIEIPVVEAQPEAPMPEPVIPSRSHHVIVGSFKEESRAKALVSTLQGKGLVSASIIDYQGRFLVSADSSTSLERAFSRQEELLDELQMENWILTIR